MTNTIMMMEAIKVMVRTEPERVPDHIKTHRAPIGGGAGAHQEDPAGLPRPRARGGVRLLGGQEAGEGVLRCPPGLEVRYEIGNADIRDLERFPDAVYHFIQEGLINAFRHGHASRVTIMLWDYGDCLRIVLDDDGIGVPERA